MKTSQEESVSQVPNKVHRGKYTLGGEKGGGLGGRHQPRGTAGSEPGEGGENEAAPWTGVSSSQAGPAPGAARFLQKGTILGSRENQGVHKALGRGEGTLEFSLSVVPGAAWDFLQRSPKGPHAPRAQGH